MFLPRGIEKGKFMSRKFFYGRRKSFEILLKSSGENSLGNILGLFMKFLSYIISVFYREYMNFVCRSYYYYNVHNFVK